MILEKAKNNRYGCSLCRKMIKQDSKYFRSVMQKWRASHTVNICERCILRMFLELGKQPEDLVKQIKDEITLETKELICEELKKGGKNDS